jgi:16S rRNA (guanine966-N2)-methyltransferase
MANGCNANKKAMIRIVGGVYKGRLLSAPKGEKTRPTSSLLRKAFFDICSHQIEGSDFLDLFAGSGAMGLEALSRGANESTFVDQSREACKVIAKNIETLEVQKQTTLLCLPIDRALKMLQKKKRSFDLIFIDPPYGKEDLTRLTEQILNAKLLKTKGKLFIEESKENEEPLDTPLVKLLEKRRYGDTLLFEYGGT